MRLPTLPPAVVFVALTVHTAFMVFLAYTFWRDHWEGGSCGGRAPGYCRLYFTGAFAPLALVAFGAWKRWRVAEGLAVLVYAVAIWGVRGSLFEGGTSLAQLGVGVVALLLLGFFVLGLVQRRTAP